ncbi:hypothetical protein CEE35_03765 [Candidatus Aerophobetes bacterium Ae_b3b]|nr:MAG: hypothetical protein CEE35_03765 [Candidatus Aerophobetes bacterium Ae_b3b]
MGIHLRRTSMLCSTIAFQGLVYLLFPTILSPYHGIFGLRDHFIIPQKGFCKILFEKEQGSDKNMKKLGLFHQSPSLLLLFSDQCSFSLR